jgi:hypothetical protein
MGRRLRWLLSIGAVLALGDGALVMTWPDARPTLPSHTRAGHGGPQGKASWTERTVTVSIPAETADSDETGCPQSAVSAILGVVIASPHGCLVGRVMPGGSADTAGLKAGDGIIACQGESVSCPSSLLPHMLPAGEDREVELTLRRWQQPGTAKGEEAVCGGRRKSPTPGRSSDGWWPSSAESVVRARLAR